MAGNSVHKLNLKIEKDNDESESKAHELCNCEDIVKGESPLHDLVKLETMGSKKRLLLLLGLVQQNLENLISFEEKLKNRSAASFKILQDHQKEWNSKKRRFSAKPYSRPNSLATKGELRSCEDIVKGELSLHDLVKLETVNNEMEIDANTTPKMNTKA